MTCGSGVRGRTDSNWLRKVLKKLFLYSISYLIISISTPKKFRKEKKSRAPFAPLARVCREPLAVYLPSMGLPGLPPLGRVNPAFDFYR
jgi:hypothetical protein